jgi:hypothetical protein
MSAARNLFLSSLTVLLVWCLANGASGRRLPEIGGEIRVSAPAQMREALIVAHTQLPLVEKAPKLGPRRHRTHVVDEAGRYLSAVFTEVKSNPDLKRWILKGAPEFSVTEIRDALWVCLDEERARAATLRGPLPWPIRALMGLGIRLEKITPLPGQGLELAFDHPLANLPTLLSGCRLKAPGKGDARAAFVAADSRQLLASPKSVEGAPFVSQIRFVKSGEPAEVDLSPGAEALGKTVRPLFNDVVMLLVHKPSALEEALGMAEADPPGFFAQRLGADLILSVVENASGENADRILPPRLRGQTPPPADPIPGDNFFNIMLSPLGRDATDLIIAGDPEDPLLTETAARIEVWARSRNQRVTFVAPDDPARSRAVADLIRWRVPTEDGLLALLALAGRGPVDMSQDLDELGSEFKVQVQSSDPSDRATAAALVEALWLKRRRVIPLFTVEIPVQASPRVGGERATLGGMIDLRDAYVWGLAP